MSLSDRWSRVLHDLHEQGRYRSLQPPAGIDFTSNDYLGYGSGRRGPWSSGPAPRPALDADGPQPPRALLSHSGLASRLLRGQHPIWEEVEHSLASWHGCEAALVMTSGYAANEGLLATVIEPQDWVASDQANHASIIDGLRLARAERFIYRHRDLNHLEEGLRQAARDRATDRQLLVVTESLFSMDGDVAPLAALAELAGRYEAALIVDEAHATGCFGPGGSGLVDAAGVRPRVLATVHTGGKALGVTGAYICGSRMLKQWLVNRCRHLIFTTALPPVVGSWWLEVLPCVRRDEEGRAILHNRAELFRSLLAAQGIAAAGSHFVVSLVLGPDRQAVRAAQLLQQQQFDIRAIRPPTVPPGTSRLRISIHADHDPDTVAAAATAVAAVLRQVQRETS